ncbi:hypothetical protein E2C01_030906 [Portunus trituberculatus]|uniref:Uncharacterized protein n=1 Tax=Portunus trituberculatus TaxID=210409 RepID=A0A5B7EW59_PORTR|nr:hypothetical protein [Portunus trituberculatus]
MHPGPVNYHEKRRPNLFECRRQEQAFPAVILAVAAVMVVGEVIVRPVFGAAAAGLVLWVPCLHVPATACLVVVVMAGGGGGSGNKGKRAEAADATSRSA